MAREYCQNCKQYVDTKKNFHSIAFVLLIIFVWLPLLFVEALMLGFGSVAYSLGASVNTGFLGLIFLVGIATFFAPFIYIVYHVFGKTARCPICNGTNYVEAPTEIPSPL